MKPRPSSESARGKRRYLGNDLRFRPSHGKETPLSILHSRKFESSAGGKYWEHGPERLRNHTKDC